MRGSREKMQLMERSWANFVIIAFQWLQNHSPMPFDVFRTYKHYDKFSVAIMSIQKRGRVRYICDKE